jgi:flagellar basal-body rod protein FlgB
MIKDLIFGKTILPGLKNGMDAMTQRQKAIADNTANAQTPGYRRKVVDFESKLQAAVGQPHRLNMTLTDSAHLAGKLDLSQVRPQMREADPRQDGEGSEQVVMEQEMSDLAQTQIKFEAAVKLAQARFEGLKAAIRGSR